MKIQPFLYFAFLLCLFGCEDETDGRIIVCPTADVVFTLAVDYTTNDFLGGYEVALPQRIDSLQLTCDYNSPSDFGDVTWSDMTTDTKLFAGTIIWMGKGVQTFPEKTEAPASYTKIENPTNQPQFIPIYHENYQSNDIDTDYRTIWKAVESLQVVSWLSPSTPAYIYLYQPSVGAGDPADWYWIIFLKY